MSAIFLLHRLCPSPRWLFGLIVWVAATGVVLAQESGFRVSDIRVNATASDAVQAQLIAIDRGQREGLERLLQRLTGERGQAMPSLQGRNIDDFVASFEVLEETVGPGTYAATIAVTYNQTAVETLLRGEGLGFVRDAGPPALLVPLWETGSGLRLWERDNAWKAAIDRTISDDSLARFVVPLGDLQDLSLLDADQAARADVAAMQRLAARYGVSEVVLARLQGSGAADEPLILEARRYGGPSEPAFRSVVRLSADEPLEVSLDRAVSEMQASLEQRVRDRATVPAGPRQTLTVIAPIEDLMSWARLRAEIEGLAEVESTAVRSLTRREAVLELEVAGGVDQLQSSLARFGWRLEDEAAAGWRLMRGAAAPEPIPPL